MQLAQVYSSIQSSLSDYSKAIPKDTTQAMLTSFTISFAIGTIVTANPLVGVIHGSFSAVATAINGLVTPLFKQFSGNNTHLTWNQNILRTAVSTIGGYSVMVAFGFKYDAIYKLMSRILLNILINSDASNNQFAKTNLMFI